ncbi:uncharacterized protein TNCV_125021 [Trichonephila clavipes]|nr:uncharacterized protein TNCV_125021 [Trichonephila clavipes]
MYVETPLHPEKLTVWGVLWAGGIIGPYFFKNDEGHNVTINGDRYRAMITNFFIPELNNHDVQELWFQQDGATCHTARTTIDLLKDTFGDRLISRFGPVNWPPRSCDLTPLDYFLWGYVKSLVYADKPQTLGHLEDIIRRVIADIRPQMLEKVNENRTSRLDYIRASHRFENFRKICMQTYKLDPCWYFTTPALSWDMLLHTKVAIELFTDYEMLLFIEKGVRGGISQCCNRYAIANSRYISNFNPDDEIKYLMYLDANNLYGYAMSKYLPLKDFVWSDNNLTEQDILNLPDESDVGHFLEVDLEYPSDFHNKHSDFPLAPEKKPPPNCKEPRLLTTLEPKTKYALHYSNLKLYLKLGLVLKKIHRVLKFFQSPWLKN